MFFLYVLTFLPQNFVENAPCVADIIRENQCPLVVSRLKEDLCLINTKERVCF